jgi:alkyl hydroperoxide reductase subunit AhpC
MSSIKQIVCSIFLLFLFAFKGDKKLSSSEGKVISNFELRNVDGKLFNINNINNAKGCIVVFTCNHCPFAKLYPQRFNDLNSKYKELGVPLIAINSMDSAVYEDETFALMQAKCKESNFNFPYLQDVTQAVGKQFGAEHTPHAFIIWKENNNWIIKYSGAIDDNGEHPELAKPYIAYAVDELLANKPVSKPETESFGCRIFYRK